MKQSIIQTVSKIVFQLVSYQSIFQTISQSVSPAGILVNSHELANQSNRQSGNETFKVIVFHSLKHESACQ